MQTTEPATVETAPPKKTGYRKTGPSYSDLTIEQRKKLQKRKSKSPSLLYILFLIVAAFVMYQVMWK